MDLLESLALAFFRIFGITEPTGNARRRAAIFLLVTLTAVLVGLGVAGYVILRLMRT